MDKAKKALSKYGEVKTCKIVNDVVTIVIGKGFSEKATLTFEFMGKISELFPDYPIMETFITETDLAIVVLKK